MAVAEMRMPSGTNTVTTGGCQIAETVTVALAPSAVVARCTQSWSNSPRAPPEGAPEGSPAS